MTLCGAVVSGAVRAFSMAAVLGVETEVQQRIVVFAGDENHVAATLRSRKIHPGIGSRILA
jgi:hypothetical protein